MANQSIPKHCFVCGRESCQLITHRLATLDTLRRLTKNKAHKIDTPPSDVTEGSSTAPSFTVYSTSLSLPTTPALAENRWIDPFTCFPIEGISESNLNHFQGYFTSQTKHDYDAKHGLSFDRAHTPFLVSQSMENRALCASITAMGATYAGIHDRNLSAPDAEILHTYDQTIQALRQQIEEESSHGISDSSIMAAINLVMCCGIGFGDVRAGLLHWQGLQSLLQRTKEKFRSGTLLAFCERLEHWLVLTCDLEPSIETWPVAIPHEKAPPEVYGSGFEGLFTLPCFRNEPITVKLWELSLNSCRATECLELNSSVASRGPHPSFVAYFGYLGGVIAQQGAQLHSKLKYTNSLSECVSITLSLFYMSVLRLTPWKAPLQHLCSQMRRALSNCTIIQSKILGRGQAYGGYSDFETDDEKFMMRDICIWILIVGFCAGRLCQDQQQIDWAIEHIHIFCLDSPLRGEELQMFLLYIVKRFCWSEMILSRRIHEICTHLE